MVEQIDGPKAGHVEHATEVGDEIVHVTAVVIRYVAGDEHEDDDKKVDHAEPQDAEGKDE